MFRIVATHTRLAHAEWWIRDGAVIALRHNPNITTGTHASKPKRLSMFRHDSETCIYRGRSLLR